MFKKGSWEKERAYTIDKKIYDSYLECLKNDNKVVDLERKTKNDKKFDLELA